MFRFCLLVTAALAVFCSLGSTFTAAADSDVPSGVAEVLGVGWDQSVHARTAAEQKYDQLIGQFPDARRVKYAYALVLIKQQQYREAARQIDDLLTTNENDLHAWRAKTWLLMITRNFAAAMVAMEQYASSLPPADATGDAEIAEQDAARYLGRLAGYLDGPAQEKVSQSVRDEQWRRIERLLTTSRRVAFQQARETTLERFRERAGEAAEEKATAQREGSEQQVQRRRDLQLERERMAARLDQVSRRRDELQSQLTSELDQLAQEDQPLFAAGARIQQRATLVGRELLSIEHEIDRVLVVADRTKDPREAARWLREADRLELLGARYSRDLGGLEVEAAAVNAQRTRLQQRAAAARVRFGNETRRLDDQLTQITRTSRRIDVDERQLGRAVTGNSRRARSLAARAAAFTTYEPFPLEQEKRRLLASFEPDQ